LAQSGESFDVRNIMDSVKVSERTAYIMRRKVAEMAYKTLAAKLKPDELEAIKEKVHRKHRSIPHVLQKQYVAEFLLHDQASPDDVFTRLLDMAIFYDE
jgi:hypothetical protein